MVNSIAGDPRGLGLDAALIAILGVALASTAAWLVARRLPGQAALRHLILLSALIFCLALPAVAWICAAAELKLVAIPILRGEQGRAVAPATAIASDPAERPPQQTHDSEPRAAALPSPVTNEMASSSANIENPVAAASAAPATPTPAAPAVQRPSGKAPPRPPFGGVAAVAAALLWEAVAALLLARFARNCLRVMRLRRASLPLQDEAPQTLLREVAARQAGRRLPLLLASSGVMAPLAVGFGRPAIILPARLLGAVSQAELRDILAHELAHLERGDHWIVLLQELAGALFWPILSVHALNRELQRAREEVCDNVVLAMRNAIHYGETLLHIAELLVGAPPMRAAVGIFGRRGELERRIAALVDPARTTTTTAGRRAACVVIGLFLAAGALLATTRFAPSARAEATAAHAAAVPAAPSVPSDPDDPNLAARFSGTVIGPDGKPVRGARVFVTPLSDGLDGKLSDESAAKAPTARATTDADGRFGFDAPDMTLIDLDGLPTRRLCVLSVQADGYGIEWITIRGRTRASEIYEPTRATDLEFHLVADDVPIHGRFLDPDGQPLADARVWLTQLLIPTDRDLDAHFARRMKRSIHSGFLTGDSDYERDIWRLQALPLITETRTDADGRFTFAGFGRDRIVSIAVSAPNIINASVSVMTRDAPDVRYQLHDAPADWPQTVTYGASFTHQLARGLTITGLVRDRDTQQPISGMWVGMNDVLTGLLSGEYSRTTDANGRFTIAGLDPKILAYEKPAEVMAVSAPGLPYLTAIAELKGDADVVIECTRGIPFRLKLVDVQGRPVEAEAVSYREVQPNPNLPPMRYVYDGRWPISRAAYGGGGIYEGFILPGPGAVLVKTRPGSAYAPAAVDPKSFFAPGRTNWTNQEQITAYGTKDTLSASQVWIDQAEYSAIVLVNPSKNSEPLELSATLVKDTPRRVTLLDPEGKPVPGVKTQGLSRRNAYEPPLRAASFPLTRLHPDRARRIMFRQDERKLIAFLEARGDSAEPYTVRMEPWGTVTGRLVGDDGAPLPIWKPVSDYKEAPKLWADFNDANDYEFRLYADADPTGRFRIERIVPGKRYQITAYLSAQSPDNKSPLESQVLRAGEVRDLGDIHTTLSYEPEYRRPGEDDEQATANIPASAWGDAVNGLRVAIVPQPPTDRQHLRWDIVAENVSDHEIRFGAGKHYEYGYCKIRIVDDAGTEARRQPGPRPQWVDTLPFTRVALKPGARMVIDPCSARLVEIDETGQPTTPPAKDVYYHSYKVQPGRYSISASVELGSGIDYPDPKSGPRQLEFAAKGEWAGKLQTGTAVVPLFDDAGERED